MTGYQVARKMVPIGITVEEGEFDHYDPKTRTVYLTRRTARMTDTRAIAVAAHEAAHAVQHVRLSRCFRLRMSALGEGMKLPYALFAILTLSCAVNLYPYAVLSAALAIMLLRVWIVIAIEWEATETALLWLDLNGVVEDVSEVREYLRKLRMSYLKMVFGL